MDDKKDSSNLNGRSGNKTGILEFTDLDRIPIQEINDIVRDHEKYVQFTNRYQDNPHALLIFSLTHEIYPEDEARRLWDLILAHWRELTGQLNRDPGIIVAALDYMNNVRSYLSEPKIIEEEKSDHISDVATIDLLTGLYTRDVFEVSLKKAIDESKRFGTTVCLAMVDIDDFKLVNDTMGHRTGDKILEKTGSIISDNIREMDVAARYGGEEMAIIMPRTALEAAAQVAERIRKKVEEGANPKGKSVTVSIGICSSSKGAMDPTSMVRTADRALYMAKREGKNRVVPLGPNSSDEMDGIATDE